MGMAIGIDLGTTNSATCIKKVTVSAICNAEGEELTPSSVTAVPCGENTNYDFVIGRDSRHLLKQYPEQTIISVKRLMGRDFEDFEVQNIINTRTAIYPITTEHSEPGSIRIPLGGKMHTPEMISGLILNKLIRDGEAHLQGKITQAVVTVPAYFSDRQKFATRAACDYAGINLLRLLPEPTAAALSFGLGELGVDESRTMMVFDLGGGTFDVSVLSFSGGSFMEITKGGDMWLGGDNIDSLLVEHILACAEQSAHCKSIKTLIDALPDADKARFLVEIKEKAEAAKIALSSEESANIEMFGILKDEHNQFIDIDVTLHREEFDNLILDIVKRVSAIATQTLHEIRFEPELIDTVLLVGGSSLVPAIQEELKRLFGAEKVMIHPRPMLAIAEGAALMAAKMTSEENIDELESFSMMHATSHDYYLQLADGKKHLLVARNTPLPVVVEEKLCFSHHEQALARLRVFNETNGILDTVGELWFHKEEDPGDFSKTNKLTELVLRFSVDEDNIITMKAWSLNNEKAAIETQIARGGLAAKLYHDLEKTLSAVVAQTSNGNVEQNALSLSRRVVATILSASDPITGETRVEQKQKAQRQINLIKGCQEKGLAPLSLYQLACMAQSESAKLLPDEGNSRLSKIIDNLTLALDNLDDLAQLEDIKKELEAFYKDLPIAMQLGQAKNAAMVLEPDYPKEAKRIRNQAKHLAEVYSQNNQDLIQDAEDLLYHLIYSDFSWSNQALGRFDRDVRL